MIILFELIGVIEILGSLVSVKLEIRFAGDDGGEWWFTAEEMFMLCVCVCFSSGGK